MPGGAEIAFEIPRIIGKFWLGLSCNIPCSYHQLDIPWVKFDVDSPESPAPWSSWIVLQFSLSPTAAAIDRYIHSCDLAHTRCCVTTHRDEAGFERCIRSRLANRRIERQLINRHSSIPIRRFFGHIRRKELV